MKTHLKPIRHKRVSDQVFDQLRELIFRGDLKPGDKIMPERELSDTLSVSRTSVRDAIRKLVVMGFLEQKQGQGTFVRSPELIGKSPLAAAMETQNATLLDLLEVRLGLECNAAWFAAKRASPKDIEFLEKSLVTLKENVRVNNPCETADVSFHMAIAYATKNPLHVYLMKHFFDFLFISIRENLLHLYKEPSNIEEIIRQHTAIFEAIRRNDAEKALDAMSFHIKFVIDFFKTLEEKGEISL